MPFRYHLTSSLPLPTTTSACLLPFIEFLLSAALLLLSATSAASVLHLRLHSTRRARAFTAPLFPVRLLLPLFATLWSLAHLLRPLLSCRAALLGSQAVAEPAFLALLLFLVNASVHGLKAPPLKPSTAAANFALALFAAALAAAPLLALHALLHYAAPYAIVYLDVPPHAFGPEYTAEYDGRSGSCTYPFLATVLLAVLGAAYVPLFLGAALGAAAVVINKRLRRRIYTLAAVVVGALAVQVVALALSALWEARDEGFRWLSLAAVGAFTVLAGVSEVVLVVLPVMDALAVGRAEEAADEESTACIVDAREGDEEECNG